MLKGGGEENRETMEGKVDMGGATEGEGRMLKEERDTHGSDLTEVRRVSRRSAWSR